jgi:hypothetical protein
LHVGIAIRDFPTGSTPSISEDAWREIPESRSSAFRSFKSHETLTQWNRDSRFPDTIKAVHLGDRWQPSRTVGGRSHRHIGNRRIGDFKDMKPLYCETAICEFRHHHRPLIQGTRVEHPERIGNRDIASPGYMCFVSSQMPKPRWKVIRLQSYGKWSHGPWYNQGGASQCKGASRAQGTCAP